MHERPRVLLVEDDQATREMYDCALRLSGFEVSSARDGLSALRFIEQQVPDVVVLDLDLPNVSGLDVHQEILAHAETRDIPIVVVTGTTWNVPGTVFRTLRKPFVSDVLVVAVRLALAQRTAPASEASAGRYPG